MQVTRTRLTGIGWLGAVLFVAPVPLSFIALEMQISQIARAISVNEMLGDVGRDGLRAVPSFSYLPFVALATLAAIGAVMVLVGRVSVTEVQAAKPEA